MAKSFLFFIPLTPEDRLTPTRRKLRSLCLKSLIAQTYTNWTAILVGSSDIPTLDDRFIKLDKEGMKEEKTQYTTKFIRESGLLYDYIIRLDDDDIFNPYLLDRVSDLNFDIYVDKYHYFYDAESGRVSRQVRYWFPNTSIQKMTNALAEYGELPAFETLLQINETVSLFENDHSKMHSFYSNKKVLYAKKNDPVYIRVLNRGSITGKDSASYSSYLRSFGLWNTKLPVAFKGILDFSGVPESVGVVESLKYELRQLWSSLKYRSILFDEDQKRL